MLPRFEAIAMYCRAPLRPRMLTIISGNFIEYLLERGDVKPVWHDYTHHDFCVKMGDGTLPRESYKTYMIQDYLYLVCPIPSSLSRLTTDSGPDSICSGQCSGELQVYVAR